MFYVESSTLSIFILWLLAILESLLGFKINVNISVKHTCDCIFCMHIWLFCPSCLLILLANEVLLAGPGANSISTFEHCREFSILLLTTLIMHEGVFHLMCIYNILRANVVLMFLIYDCLLYKVS